MKTLYLECNMGAAGDMLMAALLELHPDPVEFIRRMNCLGIPGVTVSAAPAVKCGITGTHVSVTVNGEEEESHDHGHSHEHGDNHSHGHDHVHAHDHSHEHDDSHSHDHHDHGHDHAHAHDHSHEHSDDHSHSHGEGAHHHAGMGDIAHIVGHLQLPEPVKENVLSVYGLIAGAESRAHGKPVEQVHFHEVGAMDAVADVVGVCLLLHELDCGRILASPVHVGSGQVRCAHGVLPVPAPATAHILQGVPSYGGQIKGELCTPTGAALLKHFVSDFTQMPVMRTEKIGYGMGKKDFESANCVRAFLGRTEGESDEVWVLECNLDDMTPEALAFACERLYAQGALEAYTTAVTMKKGRPGFVLTCLCREKEKDAVFAALFAHTTTIGIRHYRCQRQVLDRRAESRQTPYGPVRIKISEGCGVRREKPEYEDVAAIARREGLSLEAVEKLL